MTPSLRPMWHRRYGSGAERARLAAIEKALLKGDRPDMGPLVPLLDHLAGRRTYVFHGSKRDGIAELRIHRESTDSTEFGRQTAVFATQDPH